MQRFRLHRCHSRTGYTLLEMLLALAILLVIAGISWPMLERIYAGESLQRAAEEVRTKLTSARLTAIDQGLVYQFLYEPGGRQFSIVPYESADATLDLGGSAAGAPPGTDELNELPEGILFAEDESVVAAVSAPLGSDSDVLPPILFYPDGTATDCELSLRNGGGRFVQISVRGLTGVATVSRLQRGALR